MDLLENKGVSPLLSSSVIYSQECEHKVIGLSEYNEERSLRPSIRIMGSKRLKVPYFLTNQISCCENICNCCIFSCFFSKRKGLEDIEGRNLEIYYDQKANLEEEYDSSNPNHEDSLRFLFLNSLNCNFNNSFQSENWKKIGFSTNDPRNEFSGGGYFALLFITFYSKQYEDEFQEFLYQKRISFASITITLCFYAKLALDFISDKVNSNILRKQYKIKPVTINQFINYIEKINNDENYLNHLLAKIILVIKNEEIPKDMVINNISTDSKINNPVNQSVKEHFDSLFYKELDTQLDYLSSRTSSTE